MSPIARNTDTLFTISCLLAESDSEFVSGWLLEPPIRVVDYEGVFVAVDKIDLRCHLSRPPPNDVWLVTGHGAWCGYGGVLVWQIWYQLVTRDFHHRQRLTQCLILLFPRSYSACLEHAQHAVFVLQYCLAFAYVDYLLHDTLSL